MNEKNDQIAHFGSSYQNLESPALCHELAIRQGQAMYVVYEAPLGMLADYPEAYEGQPEFQFIEKVPTVWDETRVLNGEPAQYVTIARQHGDDWYIGGITNWDERNLAVPLDFLGQDEYEALIFADGPDANKVAGRVTIDKKRMRRSDKLNLHMASGGGFAVILTPAAR